MFLLFLESSSTFAVDDTPKTFYSIPVHTLINLELAYNPISGIAPIALNQNRFGVSYSNRYLLKETNTFLGFGSYNFKFMSLGYDANYFGNQAFWFSTQTIMIAKKLSDNLSFGVAFSHTIIDQGSQYSNVNQYTPSVGLSYKPMKKWKISSVLRNISHKQNNSLGYNDFVVSGSLFVKSIRLHTQFEKMQNIKYQLDFLGEYSIKKNLCFLLRTSTGNEPLSLGVEYTTQGISMLFLYSYHIYLGSSPELSMYRCW